MKLPPATFRYPRLSPDGRYVAVGIDSGNEANIWIYDLSGASALRRLTFGGRNRVPAWSADGQRIAFQSDRDGDRAIFAQRADGAGSAERLTTPDKDAAHVPESWSAKGDLLFTVTKGPDATLWTYSARERTSRPFGSVQSSRAADKRRVLARWLVGGLSIERDRHADRVRPAVSGHRRAISGIR